MTTDQQAAALRAARAFLGLEQKAVAAAAGLGEATLRRVERGDVSERSWTAMTAYYAALGLHIREDDGFVILVAAADA